MGMAKSVVKGGLAKRALVQLSYAIGVAKPLSLFVETYGSECGTLTPDTITSIVKLEFDARPGALARDLVLRQPKYNVTAAYCHFGREPYTEGELKFFAWEDAKDLSKYLKMSSSAVDKELKTKVRHPRQVGRLDTQQQHLQQWGLGAGGRRATARCAGSCSRVCL